MESVGGSLAFFLTLVLVSAAAHKLYARERLTFATSRLLRVNAALAGPAMLGAAALEGAAALALVVPQTRLIGGLLAALLWSGYFVVLAAAAGRGENLLDCGCSFGARSHGIDRFALLRPLVLAGLAGGVVALARFQGGAGFDPLAPVAGLAFFAFYLAADELAAIRGDAR